MGNYGLEVGELGECMRIHHLEEWRQVPVFFMEAIYKQGLRLRAIEKNTGPKP
jgi:hypothetical protein